MTDIGEWADLFPLTVTVQGFVGRDSYGTPSYGSPNSYAARIVYKLRDIRRADGQVVTARSVIWLATSESFEVNDLVTLPDGSTPLILDIGGPTDETGFRHHTKMYCA